MDSVVSAIQTNLLSIDLNSNQFIDLAHFKMETSSMNSKLTGEGDDDDEEEDVKKNIAIFTYKQWLLSIDMKTKVVQHVPRIINVFKDGIGV